MGRHGSPLHTTTSKLQLKYRTTITQEHQRWNWMEVWQLQNWVEWKSNNDGIEGATSIYTGRRSTDAERTGPTPTQINIQEGYLWIEETQTHIMSPSPWSQCQEDKSLQLLAAKTTGDWVSGGGCWSPKQFLLGTPHRDSPI